jgi:hypothetical protein
MFRTFPGMQLPDQVSGNAAQVTNAGVAKLTATDGTAKRGPRSRSLTRRNSYEAFHYAASTPSAIRASRDFGGCTILLEPSQTSRSESNIWLPLPNATLDNWASLPVTA